MNAHTHRNVTLRKTIDNINGIACLYLCSMNNCVKHIFETHTEHGAFNAHMAYEKSKQYRTTLSIIIEVMP